jgi:hypothetical protein
MSETFEKILVKDDRRGCITPKVKYQVLKGGQDITCQTYKAISQSTSNHVYNVAVPSLETIIGREVLWKSTVTLKVTTTNRPAGTYAVNYGVADALAPFPLHSLVNVMSATINNNTVSFNVQETLPLLLRMVDPDKLSKYDCMTPTALDYLANYGDAIQTCPSILMSQIVGVMSQHNQLYTAPATRSRRLLATGLTAFAQGPIIPMQTMS